LAALPAQQKFKDTVLKKDGSRLRGVEVVDMTWTSIVYKKGTEQAELPVAQFASVQWHEPPETFASAGAADRRGDYDGAANLYAEAAKVSDRKVFQLEARFLSAQAMLRAATDKDPARANDAATAFQSFVGDAGKGLRVPEAKLLLGRALRIAGKGADAEKILKEVEDTAVRENWGFVWDAKAKYEKALAQLAQNKVQDARSSYQSVATAVDAALVSTPGNKDPELEDIKMQSVIGQGETFVADKNFDEALRYFDGLAGKSAGTNPALQAAALAGKGEALYLKAQTGKDAALFRKAQIELANANLLDTDSGTGPSRGATSAKALYYTGKIILDLGPTKESPAFKARAQGYFESVVKSFGGTRWAALARAELTKK